MLERLERTEAKTSEKVKKKKSKKIMPCQTSGVFVVGAWKRGREKARAGGSRQREREIFNVARVNELAQRGFVYTLLPYPVMRVLLFFTLSKVVLRLPYCAKLESLNLLIGWHMTVLGQDLYKIESGEHLAMANA